MPIEPDPFPVVAWPNQVNIPSQDPRFYLSLPIQTDGTPSEAESDAMLQSLIDHLQTWPGRLEGANVTGSRYQANLFLVTPTDPVPPPDPPEDPPGAPEESPTPE